MLSSFTQPQVVPNKNSFFLLLNTKEDILKNVIYNLMVAIEFRSHCFQTMEV